MQTAVSHSSTEAQLISLDAGVRLAGDPALNLWDTVIDVLGPPTARDPMRNTKPKKTKLTMCLQTHTSPANERLSSFPKMTML